MLLRLLFPSWAFFDAVREVPVLEARLGEGAWRTVLRAPRRGMGALLYHPAGTSHLALQSVVDRFALECEHGTIDPVTKALVGAMVERAVRGWRDAATVDDGECRWRVVAISGMDSSASTMRVLHESAEPLTRAFT